VISVLLDTLGSVLSARCLPRPVFVVGTGRSGTSVLLQALGQHSRILHLEGEAPFLTSVGAGAALFEFGDRAEYYRQSLAMDRAHFYSALARLGFECAAGRYYGLDVFARLMRRDPLALFSKRHWCAKTFPLENHSKGLQLLYPEARFLYILRSGVEVVQSMTRYRGFRENSFRTHCATWAAAVPRYRYLQTMPEAMAIRHESLVASPEKIFREVFAFLGLPNEPRCARFVASRIVHPLDLPTREAVSVGELFRTRAPAWRDWTAEQRRIFREVCGEAMRLSGYEVPF